MQPLQRLSPQYLICISVLFFGVRGSGDALRPNPIIFRQPPPPSGCIYVCGLRSSDSTGELNVMSISAVGATPVMPTTVATSSGPAADPPGDGDGDDAGGAAPV